MRKPVDGKITSNFSEMRPLSKPEDQRDHVHGAIDIAASVGARIRAPEGGQVMGWAAYRPEDGKYWPELPEIESRPFPWCNYFYDMFGGLFVLFAPDFRHVERVHVIAHSYANQIFNLAFDNSPHFSVEEQGRKRFPIHGYYTALRDVTAGKVVGFVGNAGYSTGPHVHWEIHPGRRWYKHADRIDPEEAIR